MAHLVQVSTRYLIDIHKFFFLFSKLKDCVTNFELLLNNIWFYFLDKKLLLIILGYLSSILVVQFITYPF